MHMPSGIILRWIYIDERLNSFTNPLNIPIKLTPGALMIPLNGTRITELMWNRTIQGITGDITMTENGDRVSDYSLLDMEPETGRFVVVANFIHNRGIEYVEGTKIHWSGNRETPPADQPVCGFDGSLCPDKSESLFSYNSHTWWTIISYFSCTWVRDPLIISWHGHDILCCALCDRLPSI